LTPKRHRISLIVALLLSFGGFAAVLLTGTSPRLGLDLEGGVGVILTAESETGAVRPDVLSQTVEIIRARIDSLGVAEPEVSSTGEDNILVQLPGVEDERRALELIGSTAQLTFRQVIERVPKPGEEPTPTPTGKGGPKKKEQDEEGSEVTQETGPEVNGEEVVYPYPDDPTGAGSLYRLEPAVLTGDDIAQADAATDLQTGGGWYVALDMTDDAAGEWADFTSRLACLRDKGEQMRAQVAIVLDGKIESLTGMRSPQESPQGGVECNTGITGGESQIDVGREQEAKDLALVLRTGALPLTLEQSQVQKVSPTLGRESLSAGLTAGTLGLALVMIYMILYYRALGVVVWLGLAVFTAVLYTLLALLGEGAGLTLSLAGIAGIIVSVGVTADSYIVSFERLKDEVRSGKSVRAAAERGMARAFRTILVADFVTASAALILFWLAVGPVRGFALTLGLATLIDVLIAYFFTRPAVVLLARTRVFSEGRFFGMREALGARS
jgi:preprotein translocase subunit SecD